MATAPFNGRKAAVGAGNAISVSAAATTQVLGSNSDRLSAVILNNSAGVVYLGVSSPITTANGMPLAAGASYTDTFSGDPWFVFNGQGVAADIRVLETSVG
jgi:hypothetical protein